jgi:hypothetical protein
MIRRALILGALGLVAPAQDSKPAPEPLTVDQAVEYALRQNPALRTAEFDVKKAEDNLFAFRTRRLPSIKWNVLGGQLFTKPSVTFDRGVFGTYAGIGPVPAEETKVGLPRKPTAIVFGQILQPLSQQYRLGLGVKLHDLGRQLEAAKLAERRAAVAEQVRKAYYRLLETQSALESVEQSFPLYKETVRLAQVGLRLETVLASQQLKAEAEAAKVELEALKLRNPIATQIEALNELMGRPVNTPFRTAGVERIAEEGMDFEPAIQKALSQRPEVRQGVSAFSRPSSMSGKIRVHSRCQPGADLRLGFQLPEHSAAECRQCRPVVRLGGIRLGTQETGDERETPHRLAGPGRRRSSRSADPRGGRASAPAVHRDRTASEGEHTMQRAAREGLREQQSAFGREAVL